MKSSLPRPSLAPLLLLGVVIAALCLPHASLAQDSPDDEDGGGEDDGGGPVAPLRVPTPGGSTSAADFRGNLQIVRAPGASASGPSAKLGLDIFPEARKMPMSVHNVDAVPIERARRGGEWLCTKNKCNALAGVAGETKEGNAMLRSIKVQTPAMPVPVTIWRRTASDPQGRLDFDPSLLTQRSYKHVCAYPPVESSDPKVPPKKPDQMERCIHGEPLERRPDEGELFLGLEWPRQAELAGFKYIAVVDSCGNSLVYPFQRSFVVPAIDVVSGGCNVPDGRVLRIFPSGSFIRVTAFNLDAPAADDIMQVTYRVAVPPLENYSEAQPAKVLFPDFKLNELVIDCGPQLSKAPTDAQGKPLPPGGGPMRPKEGPKLVPIEEPKAAPAPKKLGPDPTPGEEPPLPVEPEPSPDEPHTLVPKQPGDDASPPAGPAVKPPAPPAAGAPPKALPPDDKDKGGTSGRDAAGVGKAPPPPGTGTKDLTHGVGAKPLNHGTLVIAPEPLKNGNCRIVWQSPLRARLTVPIALHVSLTRTDRQVDGSPQNLIPGDRQTWIVTANDYTYTLPALTMIDGDSRLKLHIQSDPLNANGNAVLVGDAGRVASRRYNDDSGSDEDLARRTVGSVAMHTVPLCGESNFETLEEAGSCVRAYLTIPAMLATLQITRAPWIEKPLITRDVLSAVGVALAFDSYDPVDRSAFPIAGQVGGFVQDLDEGRIGLMAYGGVAPTLPILGEGGNTTTFGFLAGLGITYITNANGPDEGFKPTAFISVVVQVGQQNPALAASGQASFGSYGQ